MKPVVLYIFLVGIPLAGVVGVLRVGENLRPPIFIGGRWGIQISPEIAGADSCGDMLIRFNGATLTISQSGSSLLLTLDNEPKTMLAGEIRGLTVIANILHQSIDKESASDHNLVSIHLQAQGERNRLQGVLKFAGCPAHTDTQFIATRQTLESSK
jgi:hypothetical protein